MKLFNRINLPSIERLQSPYFLASFITMVMSVQFVAYEGYEVSIFKVAVMSCAPFVFVLSGAFMSRGLLLCFLYWLVCFLGALFNGDMRFSTLGYLWLFLMTYATFYNLVQKGAFALGGFMKLLRVLFFAYGIVLILQQVLSFVGIVNAGILNLDNQVYLPSYKYPCLSIEPSHSARILTVAMLCYLRCLTIKNGGRKVKISEMFSGENKSLTLMFLWTMLTMSSGTAFIGLGLLSLYFVTKRSVFYIVPLLIGLFFLGESLELKQFDRAKRVAYATTTGKADAVADEDGSASARVIPLLNTFNADLTDKTTWVGRGTKSEKDLANITAYRTNKIDVVEQYGLIALIVSLVLVYSCFIRNFFSIETTVFVILFGITVANIYYSWACFMMMSTVRFFQQRNN
ncbi:MAG: hypothetical protein ACI30M_01020 [Muribaculaceae bacterium]